MRIFPQFLFFLPLCLGLAAAGGELRALVAGISEYPQFGNVPYALGSARAVAGQLRREAGLDDRHLTLLLADAATPAGRPTLDNLRQAITAAGQAAGPDDVILFYFCGHALASGVTGDAFLVPLGGLDAGTLSLTWVRDTLQVRPGVTVVLAIDSGHAHTSGRSIAANAGELIRPGVFCLAPAAADQVAYGDNTLKQTVFATAIEWSLSGAGATPPPPQLTLAGLLAGVDRFFAVWRTRSHLLQQPVWAGPMEAAAKVTLFTRKAVAPAGGAGRSSGAPAPGRPWGIPDTDIRLLPLAAGEFRMGSDRHESDEAPPHQVRFAKPFWMSECEITVGIFRAILGKTPPPATIDPTLPAESVSWAAAMSFCGVLTAQEGKALRLPAGYCYRLPTEAEWEYACRAGTGTAFSCGDDSAVLKAYANFAYVDPTGPRTLKAQPVGRYRPNPWGFKDMHGNVQEWCLDTFSSYDAAPVTDPLAMDRGRSHGIRGGGWGDPAERCRSSARLFAVSDQAWPALGFRVVLGPILGQQPDFSTVPVPEDSSAKGVSSGKMPETPASP